MNLAPLGIDPGHDVLNRTVFAGCVHSLEHEKQRPTIVGIEFLLDLRQPLHRPAQKHLGLASALAGEPSGVRGIVVRQAEADTVVDPVAGDQPAELYGIER